jgi:3-hydroxybutyryl-CoA dehydrogenase
MKEIKNVVICGSGMMGNGLCQVFASDEKLNVTMCTRNVATSNAYEGIRTNLKPFVDKGIYTQEYVDKLVSRIKLTDSRAEAVKDADFVIECVPEVMQIKQDLFAELEQYAPADCIFATNTSVMSPTEIAQKTKKRDRVVGAHFWNPPYLIPLVEVVKAEETSDEVMQATMDLMTRVGKKPIWCKKDVPGFVANRLQHALWREAISIVERGIADPATVDEALKYGPGLRLPQLAPIENADMVGLDLTLNIHNYILPHLEDSHEPSPLLKEKVANGDLGFKSGKGFQEWTPEQAAASKRSLSEYLIKVLYNK